MKNVANPVEFVKTLIAHGIIPGPLENIQRVEIIAEASKSTVQIVIHRVGGRAVVDLFANASATSYKWNEHMGGQDAV